MSPTGIGWTDEDALFELDIWIRQSLKDTHSPEQTLRNFIEALDDNAVAMGYVKRCDGSYFQPVATLAQGWQDSASRPSTKGRIPD